MPDRNPVRLGYVVSHPIQYQAPLLRRISRCEHIDLRVFFLSDFSTREHIDPGFGTKVEWDVPLLEGYNSELLPGLRNHAAIGEPLYPFNTGIASALNRHRIEALWLHGYSHASNLRSVFAARRRKIPVLMRAESQAGGVIGSGIKRKAKDSVVRWIFKRIDAFLCVGTENRRYYTQHGVPEAKLFSMPYAVDNVLFQRLATESKPRTLELRHQLGITDTAPVVLYASKLTERKRAIDLLKAWQQLSDTAKSAHLLVVGDGETRESLQSFSSQNKLPNIHFLGFKNQTALPAFYQLCDVFVLPSEREQWGLIVNEVMNAAKPVIVSDEVGAAADLVRNGKNGFVYRTGDSGELSMRLRELLSDSDLRSSMGALSLEIINAWDFEADVQGLTAALDYLGLPPRAA